MTDETTTSGSTEPEQKPRTTRPRASKAEVIEDAVVVEEPTAASAEVAETEPEVVVDTEPEPATTPPQQVVYVQVPAPPRPVGNRGLGAAVGVIAGVVYAALLAGLTLLIQLASSGRISLDFLATAQFYIPTLLFIVAFVVLVLIINRASWWAYIVGSFLVAVAVYFGTIGLGLLSTGIILDTPAEGAARFAAELRSPFIIVAAILAREVSIWAGAILSRRGRRLKVRNAEARAEYEQELADRRAEYDRPTAV